MSFQPQINDQIVIDQIEYRVAEHPNAPGMPFGQEGRAATVYQLIPSSAIAGEARALKVFKPRFRVPALFTLKDKLAAFADLPGLPVCRRTVLTPQHHTALLRQYPDLTYAVLMPWIEGPTWWEIIGNKRVLTPVQGLTLARALAHALATLEQHGVAHCDLSAPNVLLPALAPHAQSQFSIAFVDVEQLYAPGLDRPAALTSGSLGYAPAHASNDFWRAEADRFAGAILIAEMLAWGDARVRQLAGDESYFAPDEIQRDNPRTQTLIVGLREHWGDRVVELFERAWHSQQLADCPTFGEWMVSLPDAAPETRFDAIPLASATVLTVLVDQAKQLESRGDLASAQEAYHAAITRLPAGDPLRAELGVIVERAAKTQASERELDHAIREAEQAAQTAQWTRAVAAYRAAVTLAGDSPRAFALRDARARCEKEEELARLFDGGVDALRRNERTAARELFSSVIRRQPDYTRNGQRVATLYEQAAREEPSPTRVPIWALGVAALLLVFCFLAAGVAVLGIVFQPTPTPTRAIALVTPPPAQSTFAPTIVMPTLIPPTFAPIPTDTRVPTVPPTRTAVPTLTPRPTATSRPPPTPMPTDPPCVVMYPVRVSVPPGLRPERQEAIAQEVNTWIAIEPQCIHKSQCATLRWDAYPERISEIWTDRNLSFALLEFASDNLNTPQKETSVGKSGSQQVCPVRDTAFMILVRTAKGYIGSYKHLIVWP